MNSLGNCYWALVCGRIWCPGTCIEWKNEGSQISTWLFKSMKLLKFKYISASLAQDSQSYKLRLVFSFSQVHIPAHSSCWYLLFWSVTQHLRVLVQFLLFVYDSLILYLIKGACLLYKKNLWTFIRFLLIQYRASSIKIHDIMNMEGANCFVILCTEFYKNYGSWRSASNLWE